MPAPEPQIDRLLSWAARTSIRPHHRTGPRNADALVGCERAVPGAAKNHPGGGTPSGRLSMTSPGTPATGSPGSSDGVFGLDPAVALAGPSALVKYAKFGCVNCREQHLKCDRVTPKCGTCQRSNRQCRPTGLKIRLNTDNGNGKLVFSTKQKWVKTPKRLVFIDETKTIIRDVSSPGSGADEFDDNVSSEGTVQGTVRGPAQDHVRYDYHFSDSGPRSPSERFLAKSNPLRAVPQEPLKWPLPKDLEGRLVRHFVQNLALWLDLCDPCRSFEIIVPERARSCPMLLNAILTLAARHKAQTSDPQLRVPALEYSLRCYRYVSASMMINLNGKNQEDCFAAAIILRVVEEIEEAHQEVGIDNGRILVGIRSMVDKDLADGKRLLVHSSLGAASYWVGLRQEIYRAVMHKKPVEITLVHSLVDKPLIVDDESGQNDYDWANRAVVHCAKVLNYVFGPREDGEVERWQDLHSEGQAWEKNKPASFNPYVVEEDQSKAFPEIWFLRSCHVIGTQHALLAESFLEYNRPVCASREDRASITKTVQMLVRRICGIGLGNDRTAPSMFTACMAISAFGDLFPNSHDQVTMLEILRDTERRHARPTEQVQNDMRKKWKWA